MLKQQPRYYLSRFWLAIALSSLIFLPYLSRYSEQINLLVFHWTQWDLLSLLSSIFLLGNLFFVGFLLLYVRGNTFTRKLCDIVYCAMCGLSIASFAFYYFKYFLNMQGIVIKKTSPWIYQNMGSMLLISVGVLTVYVSLRESKKIKELKIRFFRQRYFFFTLIVWIFCILKKFKCPYFSKLFVLIMVKVLFPFIALMFETLRLLPLNSLSLKVLSNAFNILYFGTIFFITIKRY